MYSEECRSSTPITSLNSPAGSVAPTKHRLLGQVLRGHRRQTFFTISLILLAGVLIIPLAVGASDQMLRESKTNTTLDATNNLETKLMANPANESKYSKATPDPSTSSTSSQTTVTVNGQPVEVPSNGSYSKTIIDNNGRTEIDVDSSHHHTSSSVSSASGSESTMSPPESNSASSQSSSSVKININSHSSSGSSGD